MNRSGAATGAASLDARTADSAIGACKPRSDCNVKNRPEERLDELHALPPPQAAPAAQRACRAGLQPDHDREGRATSAADYVFLDCEDAVAPPDKEQARKNIIQALNDIDWKAAGKTVSVRINGLDTHYMYRDVVDIMEQAGSKLDTILIPKVGVPADVYTVEGIVSQIEVGQGLHQHGRPRRR